MRILTIATAACLLLAGALQAAAQQTKVLTAEKFNEYGLIYSLPRTAVRVTVTARKHTEEAGPYFQYAKKFIGTDKVVKESASFWTITDVKMEPYGVADSGTQYLMQLKPGATTYIGVADDGMLLSVNAAPRRSPSITEARPATGSALQADINEYLQYAGEDFMASQSKAKQAEMLAASLMEVRDSYTSLTRGTADNMPTDGKQLDLMLSSLRKQEEALTRAFTGFSYDTSVTRTFTYLPEKEGKEILFRLSDFGGFTDKDDYAGDPVYITTKIVREGTVPADANGEPKKFPKDGIVYSIPGTVKIGLTFLGDKLGDQDFEMSQFGTVFALNPLLFTTKKDRSYAIFSDTCGSLLEIGSVRNLNEQEAPSGVSATRAADPDQSEEPTVEVEEEDTPAAEEAEVEEDTQNEEEVEVEVEAEDEDDASGDYFNTSESDDEEEEIEIEEEEEEEEE